MATAPAPSATSFGRVVGFFRRHPVLLLLCFSPGIPEYLSGSSSFALLALNPLGFLLFLGLNLGLYGPGVLLVREALVRWQKGWAAVLALGAAYGLLEEGTALSTLFDPNARVVGGLGTYGHYLGVNWIWAIGVLQVHIVLSIGLPILLLGLALPETRGRSLLDRRQIGVALGLLTADVVLLALLSHYYPTGLGLQLLALGCAAGLVVVAYRLPRGLLDPTSERPRFGRGTAFVLGLLFFPVLLIVPGILESTPLGAVAVGLLELLASGALFFTVLHGIGRSGNEGHLVVLAFGALLPIALFGLLAQLAVPVVAVADGLFALFFYRLGRMYGVGASTGPPSVPSGAR